MSYTFVSFKINEKCHVGRQKPISLEYTEAAPIHAIWTFQQKL